MTNPERTSTLPVAVLGAGPVGLAAAAELLERGETPIVFEQAGEVGAAVREWGHVRIFSPWRYCIDPAAGRFLEATGWVAPAGDTYPTGDELVERYLRPLAAVPELARTIRFNARVVAVAREGMDRMTTAGREERSFEIRVLSAEVPETLCARAVIDASGTWGSPNPLGAQGLPAIGEDAARDRIYYGIPNVLHGQRDRYAGRRVLVIGRGHSAFNSLLELIALKDQVPGTEIVWAIRKTLTNVVFGGGSDDALPERGRLGERVHSFVQEDQVQLLEAFAVARVELVPDGVRVLANDGRSVLVDEVVCATGFRPDLSLTTELRLGLDEIVEAPTALAALIDPNLHSCGTVPPHGEAELAHPEKNYYAVGMKSYGRAPTFLMLTGYEQVRSIAAALTGDAEGARRLELVLPKTGVCSGGAVQAEFTGRLLNLAQATGSCCTATPGAASGACCGEAEVAGAECCEPPVAPANPGGSGKCCA